MSKRDRRNYATISYFGSNDILANDPLTYCLTDTIDDRFNHASSSTIAGGYQPKCQLYMAQRAASKWDKYSEHYYNHFDELNRQNVNFSGRHTIHKQLSVGQNMLKNAAQLRFCRFGGNCDFSEHPFDHNVADSPTIVIANKNCAPCCKVDPDTIDNDSVMQKCLADPSEPCIETIINICNNAKNDGVDLSGTNIGKWAKSRGFLD